MEILKVSQKNSKQIIEKTLKFLEKRKVIVFPTDTVYGLICDATNKKAVDKIFKIKKRPKSKPLPIFVKDIKMAKKLTEIDENQGKFLKKVWPGKVTVVLKRKPKQKLYGVDKEKIALRIPKYKLLNNLLKKINKPLAQSSANISGKPASGNIEEILRQFEGKKFQPDLVIDAGVLPKNKPSTVLDLTVFPPKVIRP